MAESNRLDYHTVDVFTAERYAGNPLAIVTLPSLDSISQQQKQAIAREFNYSETVFLSKRSTSDENEWDLKIFLPFSELPFAGHPVIGTAWSVLNSIQSPSSKDLIRGTLHCPAGAIPISLDPETDMARASVPQDLHIHETKLTTEMLVSAQPSLSTIDAGGTTVLSLVPNFIAALVPLPSLSALSALRSEGPQMKFPQDAGWDVDFGPLYFFVELGEEEGGALVRVRTRMVHIFEDPVTGSAAASLASWIALQRGRSLRVEVTQGVEMGREGKVVVEVELVDGKVSSVVLQGTAVEVMRGSLLA